MPRIYISPSSQEHNAGLSPFKVEEIEMNKIADVLVPLLNKDGRFMVKRNSPAMEVGQMATDSNNFLADIHVALHSNAGGGVGTEVYAYAPNTNSEKLAQSLYNQISPLSPGKDRGIKFNKGLWEVGDNVKATSALIELGFHDNAQDAFWLATNSRSIAIALYKGICDFYSYDYKSLVVAPPVTPPTPVVIPPVTIIYRVILDGKQTIALASKDNAIAVCKSVIDGGSATNGTVQRNTDSVNVFQYTKTVIVVPPVDVTDVAVMDLLEQAIKILKEGK